MEAFADLFQNRAILSHTQTTPECDEGIVTPWHSNAELHDDRAMRWRLLRHATQLEYGVKCSPRVLRTSWETGPSVAPVTVLFHLGSRLELLELSADSLKFFVKLLASN